MEHVRDPDVDAFATAFDSVSADANKSNGEDQCTALDGLAFDSSADALGEKIGRANAMATVLTWIEEGDFSFEALDGIVQGLADIDKDGDDDETEYYRDILSDVADAMIMLGASEAATTAFLEEGSGGESLGGLLKERMDSNDLDDYELVGRFSDSVRHDTAMDAVYRKKRVVRNGVVKIVKRALTRVVLSAAQKAGLRKARKKANTGMAKMRRKRSIKARQKRGL